MSLVELYGISEYELHIGGYLVFGFFVEINKKVIGIFLAD